MWLMSGFPFGCSGASLGVSVLPDCDLQGQQGLLLLSLTRQRKGLASASCPALQAFVEPAHGARRVVKAILLILLLVIAELPRIHLFYLSEIRHLW